MRLIFVYGTLQRGFGLNDVLARGRAIFIREALTAPNYSLYAAGIPFMVAGGSTAVRGEVWEVPEALLPSLDRIEGAYDRRPVALGDGTVADAYLYRGDPHSWALRPLADGDYRAYMRGLGRDRLANLDDEGEAW